MSASILVDTDWLHESLYSDDVRIFNCTTILAPDPTQAYTVQSGRYLYVNGQIRGACFLHMQGDFWDNDSKLRFTVPSSEQFARVGEG